MDGNDDVAAMRVLNEFHHCYEHKKRIYSILVRFNEEKSFALFVLIQKKNVDELFIHI